VRIQGCRSHPHRFIPAGLLAALLYLFVLPAMLLALTLPQAIILWAQPTSSPTPRQNLPQRSSLAASVVSVTFVLVVSVPYQGATSGRDIRARHQGAASDLAEKLGT